MFTISNKCFGKQLQYKFTIFTAQQSNRFDTKAKIDTRVLWDSKHYNLENQK